MTPDLERVARAICRRGEEVVPGHPSCLMDDHPDRGPCTERNCASVKLARAAVAALKEPSEAMVGAAECALSDWRKTLDRDEAMMRSYKPNHQRKFIASATPEEKHKIRFQAMLRAVLGDEQEGAGR